jgi:hypothetical protein
MPEQTPPVEFDGLRFNATTGRYEATLDKSAVGPLSISITANEMRSGCERISAFLAWLCANDRSFKLSLEDEIQNHDLVWDDVWTSFLGEGWIHAEAGFLVDYLSYDAIEFDRGAIHVWVDTGGLHTDHKIRATINETMQIEICELM